MDFLREILPEGWVWWRIADPAWENPLDPGFAGRPGGRWNPPDSFPALYLNEDMLTARLNLRMFIANWPYEPEDLRDETAPVLVGCALPPGQIVCEAYTVAGLRAAGLPDTYPLDGDGAPVTHTRCQRIGEGVKEAGLRGVRARSAQSRDGTGRELAWFPASSRDVARRQRVLDFGKWFLG